MSGKTIFTLLFLLLITRSAQAFEPGAPIKDPLQTMPGIIDSGVSLPGDSAPVACPVIKDFMIPLTLAEAVDIALCNNPQIKVAWASIKVQAGTVGQAKAAYLPTATGTFNEMRTGTDYLDSHAPSSSITGQGIYGTLSWRLFDFGGRNANLESANNLLVAAMETHNAALQKTLSDVIQSYFDVHTTKALLQAKEQDEAIAVHSLEIAKQREAHGTASHGEMLQAGTALAKVSLEKNRAEGDYRKALSVLVYSLGVPLQTNVIISDELDDSETTDSKSLQEWMEIAEKSNPSILAARAQWESSRQKILSAQSEGLPTVDFSGGFYQNGYPGQGLSAVKTQQNIVGVSISFPLFDGFSHTYKVRSAEAQAEQNEAQLHDTEHNTLMGIVKAHADAMASLQNLEASKRLLDMARKSLASSQRRYEKGVGDILELLQAQSALADARQERIRSIAEWRSSRLRLLASVGVVGRDSITR